MRSYGLSPGTINKYKDVTLKAVSGAEFRKVAIHFSLQKQFYVYFISMINAFLSASI